MEGSDTAGVANVENVRGLFEKERLSCDLGWRPRAEPITLNSLGLKALELFNANPQAVPEGATITKDPYKDIFEVVDGGSAMLNNITGGLASAVGL